MSVGRSKQPLSRADIIVRAKALAAGLKVRLQDESLPALIAEVGYLLEESHNVARPLLERIRILGLLASSLDQYFAEQMPVPEGGISALPSPQWLEISAWVEPLLQQAVVHLQGTLLPALAAEYGIILRRPEELNEEQRAYLHRFFHQQVYPLLTPLAIDPGHPFPFISSHSINLLVHISSPDAGIGPLAYARIKVPRFLPRFVEVPSDAGRVYLWSEDAVAGFLQDLFPGMQLERVFLFRILRAAPNRRSSDELVAQSRWQRNQQLASAVVHLEVEAVMPDQLVEWLAAHLAVPSHLCYRSPGPLAMFQLIDLANLADA